MTWDLLDGRTLTLTSLLLFTTQAAGVLSALHAIQRVRTAQATTAWCVALLALPLFAVPAYWIFGRSRFFSYRDTLRRLRDQHSGPAKEFTRYLDLLIHPEEDCDVPLHAVANVVDQPITHGNQLQLLINGELTFEALLTAIAQAREYLLVQFFIIEDDFIGNQFAEALIERAHAGVRVYLIYDDIGSHWLPRHYLQRLTDAGVKVSSFSNRRTLFHRLEVNFRNHRKLLIADGRVALTGGLNVGDEYLDGGRKFSAWRDTHLSIRGPAVQALQSTFCQDWYWANLEILDHLVWEDAPAADAASTSADNPKEQNPKGQAPAENPKGQALVVPTGPADRRQRCSMLFCELAYVAKKRLWISTPYFVPDEAVALALESAVARGVEVRLLLPARADHLLVFLAGHYNEFVATQVGIQSYRYDQGFLHQKAVLVDDSIAAVGSANLDNRSLHLNFELMVASSDPTFVRQATQMLEQDFAAATPTAPNALLERPFWFRMLTYAARLFSPVL